MITREGLMVLENNLSFTRGVDRQYDDQFAKSGAKIGSVLNIRKPVRFTNTQGQGLQLQDLTETSVPLVLTTQYQRSFAVTSSQLALDIDDFSKRFIRPAMISMANQIDFDGMQQFLNVNNEVGTPGTIPNTSNTYLAAGQKLDENAAPVDIRDLVINPAMQATIVPALTGLFNPQVTISAQYRKGRMSKDTLGFDWYMDQNTPVFTTGTQGGTPVSNSATVQTGSSIITNGWSNSIKVLNKGDIITFGTAATKGLFAVNPQSRQSTGSLAQWVVTADVTSDGSGNATIPISGPDFNGIIASGPTQNVTSLTPTNAATMGVQNTAAVTVQGTTAVTSGRGIAFCEEAFTFACADLPLYGGLDMGDRKKDDQLNMSMRCIRMYDINMDRAPLRIDLLGGWATLYPQLAVRIAS
jgi:hypothetical protein